MNYPLLVARRFLLLAFVFLSLIAPSCKKTEEPTPPPTNSEKILGVWHLTELLENVNLDGQFVSVLEPCNLDDTWDFIAGGTLYIGESGTSCGFFPPEDIMEKWELQDNETILQTRFSVFIYRYKISALNDTMLVLHQPLNNNPANDTIYSKTTFKR